MARLAWAMAAVVALAACGGTESPDPCARMSVRCNAAGLREVCAANGSWTPTEFACTTNIAIDDEVGSICATKADGRARCWGRDGAPAGELVLPAAAYVRVQRAIVGPLGLTGDGQMFGPRGAIPDDLPPIADFRATNLWSRQGLCLLTRDGDLLYGNHNLEADPPLALRVEAGPFVDVSCAWEGLIAAVRPDGTLWRVEWKGVIPSDGWARMSISSGLFCGLTRGSEILCAPTYWGTGAPKFTAGPYRQVATSDQVACALHVAGKLACFRGDGVELAVDPGPYTFIDAALELVCGIRPDGTSSCFRHNGVSVDRLSQDPTLTALLPIAPALDPDW